MSLVPELRATDKDEIGGASELSYKTDDCHYCPIVLSHKIYLEGKMSETVACFLVQIPKAPL